MELNIDHAVIAVTEPICSTMQEQGVELDYILPDYYPDVCKLVKCTITPTLLSQSLSPAGDRLSYELQAQVRILYCSAESHVLQCVTQTLHFSRHLDFSAPFEHVTAELIPTTDHVTCRAVSPRRLDVRGAVSIRIKAHALQKKEVIRQIHAPHIQQKPCPLHFISHRLHTEKSLLLSEELELGSSRPPVLHVVRCETLPTDTSHSLVSGKLLVQGSLRVRLLYACEQNGDASLEQMLFSLPYSQLVELDGIEEQDLCEVQVRTTACELKPVADTAGEVRVLRCEAELLLSCTAHRLTEESPICDAFSTEYPTTCTTAALRVETPPHPLSAHLTASPQIPCEDFVPDQVYDCWCDVRRLHSVLDPEHAAVQVSGMLCCQVLVREESGMPRLLEREEPFEHHIPLHDITDGDEVSLHAVVENCTYTLSAPSTISLKAELRLEGSVRHSIPCELLTAVRTESDKTLPRRCALKLCYASEGEAVWAIAKRCHTSVEAIMEENGLMEEQLLEDRMLLIPIVHQ